MVKRGSGTDYIGVGVGAVILNDRHELLLLRRKCEFDTGLWTIPGGGVEWFETCVDAIKRECREEVGVEIEVDRLLTVVDHIVRESGVHWVSLEYLVHITSGKAHNADKKENHELRWFPLDALPERLTQPSREAVQCILPAPLPARSLRS